MWDFFIFSHMRKYTLKLAVLAAFLAASACKNAGKAEMASANIEDSAPADEVELHVSRDTLRSTLEYLASDELHGRLAGSEGIEKAAEKIEGVFRRSHLQPYFKTYRDSFPVGDKQAFNIVGIVEGNDPKLKDEYVILGAHYDHIGEAKAVDGDTIANGANDNAAGTVAVLEIAKKFAALDNNKRSVMFILFSAEEEGLVGSSYIAKELKEKGLNLYAMLNLEMIGVPMKDKQYEAYITGYDKSNMAEKLNDYAGKEVAGFLPQAKEYQLFSRSDNYSFFNEFHVPAQTLSTFDFTNYDYYHHVSDEADQLDIPHMASFIEDLFPAVYAMANTEEQEIKLKE